MLSQAIHKFLTFHGVEVMMGEFLDVSLSIFAFGDQFLFKLRWHRVNQCRQIHFGILSRGYATAVADSIAHKN